MNAHAVIHHDITFDCDECDKTFKSPAYLKQHQQGKHKGFITRCRVIYPWLKPKFHHEEHCSDCRNVNEKWISDHKKIQ